MPTAIQTPTYSRDGEVHVLRPFGMAKLVRSVLHTLMNYFRLLRYGITKVLVRFICSAVDNASDIRDKGSSDMKDVAC